MRRAALLLAGALAAGTLPPPAKGQGVPVFDASGFAQLVQQVEQMTRDYQAQIDQLNQLTQQYETMVQQLVAMTGIKGMSAILNSAQNIAARVAAIDGLGSIVEGAIAGTEIRGNTAQLNRVLSELRTTFELDRLPAFQASEFPQDRAIATLAASGMAAIATAEDSYSRANTAMDRVNDLIATIDTAPDVKASVDLNTRVLAELAVLMNENLRLQAALTNALGAQALHDARDGVASREFLRVPPDE